MKSCSGCKDEKLLGEFNKSARSKDGKHTQCKLCSREHCEDWRKSNPREPTDEDREWHKAYYLRNKGTLLSTRMLWKYKLTKAEFQQKFEQQDGKCAICKELFIKAPNVDHDHLCCSTEKTCGKCLRGLLCQRCNLLLGKAKDSSEILSNAIEYLKIYKERKR